MISHLKHCFFSLKFSSLKMSVIFVSLLFCCLSAQEMSVHSFVDKSEITIGDKITYKIVVSFPMTGTLELPSVLGNLGNFEVKEFDVSEPAKIKNAREQTWKFIISTFTVGSYTIPPQIIEYTPDEDTVKQFMRTEPIMIEVKRSTPETVKDIADITGLVNLEEPRILSWILIFLFICLITGAVLWIYLKRRKKSSGLPVLLPPYEEAMESLAKLQNLNLPGAKKYKEYCFSLSEILRRYINRRFQVDALESTTEEFLEKIKNIDLTEAERDLIRNFCEKTDLVKFADFTLSDSDSKDVYSHVHSLVKQTRPRELTAAQNGQAEDKETA